MKIGTADDKDKPQFAQLPADKSIETITLEEALELFKLPRQVGEFEGTTVTIGAGRFGPYVLHKTNFHQDLDVRGMRGDEALNAVQYFIDDGATPRNHRGRTAIRHHIRLDSAVSRRTHRTEGGIHALLIDTSHRQDVLGISREVDFLPSAHAIVASRVDTDDTLVGTHRGNRQLCEAPSASGTDEV